MNETPRAPQKCLLVRANVINTGEMHYIGRFSLALLACVSLTNCQLINTAIRLAPYLLLLAEDEKKGPSADPARDIEMRGRAVQQRGEHGLAPKWAPIAHSQMAAR